MRWLPTPVPVPEPLSADTFSWSGQESPATRLRSMYSWNPRDTFSLSQPGLHGRTKSYKKRYG